MKAFSDKAIAGQRGLTVIELMVALVVGLVISIAASAIYLGTRSATVSTQSMSDQNETGQLALDLLGREIKKAGFFPAQFGSETQPLLPGSFINIKDPTKPAFDQGIFGCRGAAFDPSTNTCGAPVDGAPDGLVINYMSTPEFGDDAAVGNHRDCNRATVSSDPDNAAAVAANRPLFVSNRFSLVSTSYTAASGRAVDTFSLACHGNGEDDATAPTPHLAGIEDLVITYGVWGTANQQTPNRYYTATEVGALPVVDGLTPWQRVTSIRVCLVVRTPDAVRQAEDSSTARTFTDCRGDDVTLSNTDRTLLKRFERVYAVRNNLKAAL
jgi:type IV pilus assembly protein PilW